MSVIKKKVLTECHKKLIDLKTRYEFMLIPYWEPGQFPSKGTTIRLFDGLDFL
jgi:hypothetical protein